MRDALTKRGVLLGGHVAYAERYVRLGQRLAGIEMPGVVPEPFPLAQRDRWHAQILFGRDPRSNRIAICVNASNLPVLNPKSGELLGGNVV